MEIFLVLIGINIHRKWSLSVLNFFLFSFLISCVWTCIERETLPLPFVLRFVFKPVIAAVPAQTKQHVVPCSPWGGGGGGASRCLRSSETKRSGAGLWHVDKFEAVKFYGLLPLRILHPAFPKIELSNNQRETEMLSNCRTAPTVLWIGSCFPSQRFSENKTKCSQVIITTSPIMSV